MMLAEYEYDYINNVINAAVPTDRQKRIMSIASKLRRCKEDYLGLDVQNDRESMTANFEEYVLDSYGIKYITGESEIHRGVYGISDFKIVDDQKFLLFNLKYT